MNNLLQMDEFTSSLLIGVIQILLLFSCLNIWIEATKISVSWYSIHTIGMGLAILFASNAIFMLQQTPLRSKPKLYIYHKLLQIATVCWLFLGFAAIYISREKRGKQHYTSWHGLSGLLTFFVGILKS